MNRQPNGFTLVELMTGMAVTGVIVSASLVTLMNHNRVQAQQTLAVAMEQNLRVGMDSVADAVRFAGYGVPPDLDLWIPWFALTDNPMVGTNDFSVAGCTPYTVAELDAQADADDKILYLASAVSEVEVEDLISPGAKGLILIGDDEYVRVVAVANGIFTIDTDPEILGNQGLSRAYASGTPVCRVDVQTYRVAPLIDGGPSVLQVDNHHGGPPLAVAEGITGLQFTAVELGLRYRITLTAQSGRADPLTGLVLTRSLASDVTLRNGG